MTMHDGFADWYRSAAVAVPDGLLQKRWSAVAELTSDADNESVVSLAKLFVLPADESLVPEGFREAFRKHDDSFASKGNLQELRVLAGAVLRSLMEGDTDGAHVAALAVVCGCFGRRPAALPEADHLDAAQKVLIKAAQHERNDGLSIQAKFPTKKTLAEALQQPFNSNNLATTYEPLTRVLMSLSDATSRSIQALERRLLVREEELNMVWWLQTESSRDLEKSFNDVGFEAGALVFGSEAADLTRVVPGPASVVAILMFALRKAGAVAADQPVTLAKAVNATPRVWRERIDASHAFAAIESLCPVHLAIKKSLTTDGADDWFPVYRKVSDIALTESLAAVQFCVQTYRERMLLAAISEGG
jgi:hypothetical protein